MCRWTAVPDPLDDQARQRPLAPKTRRLRREQIHSAVSAAVAAGIDPTQLTSLASLVDPEVFKATLGRRWKQDGRKLTAYAHGIAGTLVAIAAEWVKIGGEALADLKTMRRKLGSLPTGLTPKNQALLRIFDDPRLLERLIALPDKLWRGARRDLAKSRRPFIDLQNALAIDLLIHVHCGWNLAALKFDVHLHWPQGRGRAANIVFAGNETKTQVQIEFEIPAALADRFHIYRNEIAPTVIGKRPDAVFVKWTGQPRGQAAITDAIEKTILKNLGVRLTPHQFRHLAAKIILDDQSQGLRTGKANLGSQEHQDHHELLCRHRYAPCRACACRTRHATQRERSELPGPCATAVARGVAPCRDRSPDCICRLASGPWPTSASGNRR